jgi:hypothetical protein
MMERTMTHSELFPFQVGDKIIDCQSADDRQLLSDAVMISTDNTEAAEFTQKQRNKIGEACGFYGLTMLQQTINSLADADNA